MKPLIGFATGVLTLILGTLYLVGQEEKLNLPASGSVLTDSQGLLLGAGGFTLLLNKTTAQYSAVELSGGIHEGWLKIERSNSKDPAAKGFDPAYTTATSFLKPVSKKVGDKWETHWETDL